VIGEGEEEDDDDGGGGGGGTHRWEEGDDGLGRKEWRWIFSSDRRFVLRGDVCVCGVCIPRPSGSASAIATFLSRAIVELLGGQGRAGG
jgi:hypothetical protein